MLDGGLAPDRDRVALVAANVVPDLEFDDARAAVTELSAHLDRYRTYLPDDEPGRAALETARLEAAAARPDLAGPLDRLSRAIAAADEGDAAELRTRWQQLTGPATAKGVEDRAFWRYLALASLGEVGGQVEPAPDSIAALHDHHAMTAARWPTTMLAGTTHDVARSEDVRAVGLVLASAAEAWTRVVDERVETPSFPDIDLPMRWMALQTVATTPGLSAERLAAFLVKAAREADRRTSWVEPDETYEQRLTALAQDVLVWPPVAELAASLDGPGRATALAMLAVRATAPGVPDVYQGTEAFRFLLVDPDNRRPPDLGELEELVHQASALDAVAAWNEPSSESAKAVVLHRLLALRRRLPDVFGPGGGYVPLATDEEAIIAFARTDGSGCGAGGHGDRPSRYDATPTVAAAAQDAGATCSSTMRRSSRASSTSATRSARFRRLCSSGTDHRSGGRSPLDRTADTWPVRRRHGLSCQHVVERRPQRFPGRRSAAARAAAVELPAIGETAVGVEDEEIRRADGAV